jgi:hypothetical protein
MRGSRVHPILLIGLLSLAAANVLEGLAGLNCPTDFLQGFLDGLAVVSIYGYLLALRSGRFRQL